jgi:hypothetical protein
MKVHSLSTFKLFERTLKVQLIWLPSDSNNQRSDLKNQRQTQQLSDTVRDVSGERICSFHRPTLPSDSNNQHTDVTNARQTDSSVNQFRRNSFELCSHALRLILWLFVTRLRLPSCSCVRREGMSTFTEFYNHLSDLSHELTYITLPTFSCYSATDACSNMMLPRETGSNPLHLSILL